MGVTPNTARAFALLRRELEDNGIVVNTTKNMALALKGQAPTGEEILLLENVDVHIVGEGRVTVVGVTIVTDEYVLERASEVMSDGGADGLAHCFTTCWTRKRRPAPPSNPSGRTHGR